MSPARNERRARPNARCAFSLLEAVLVLGIMAVLLVGMSGALTMSLTALDRGKDRHASAVAAAHACDQVLADLADATEIAEHAAGGVSFALADRDGNSEEESIAYGWSGTPGSPLAVSIDGAEPQTIVSGVESFSIQWLVSPDPAATTTERVLISFEALSGATLRTQIISRTTLAAQYLKPAFADNVSAWGITRLRLRLAADLVPTGTLRVSLVRAVDWQPTGEVLSSVDIPELSLPLSAGWVDVAVSAGPLLPGEGVFIVLRDVALGGLGAGSVEYGQGGTGLPYNTFLTTSTNSGSTWTPPQDTADMRFIAYGTITTR